MSTQKEQMTYFVHAPSHTKSPMYDRAAAAAPSLRPSQSTTTSVVVDVEVLVVVQSTKSSQSPSSKLKAAQSKLYLPAISQSVSQSTKP